MYAGTHAETYAYIDAHLAEHTANLIRWVRQPSVSAQNHGVREMAELLRDDLKKLGFKEAELVPTSGHPGVWGFYDAGAPKTLAIYMMYDVQPVEPTGWSVPAFDGAVVDHPLGKVLMARGATNQKGPERAFLNALASIIATKGKLPVNLMVVAEGEEVCESKANEADPQRLLGYFLDLVKSLGLACLRDLPAPCERYRPQGQREPAIWTTS